MDWKQQIDTYYEQQKPTIAWTTKEEIIDYFEGTILPAFEDIADQLKPYTKNLKVQKHFHTHTFSASISFEDKPFSRSRFLMKIITKSNEISVETSVNEYSSMLADSISVDSPSDIEHDDIIQAFMKFFNGRADFIARAEKANARAEEDDEY